MLEKLMVCDKKGKKFFAKRFIKKLKLYNNNDEVESLIENVDPQELIDCYGKTLLHHAVEAGNELLVEYLIGRGFVVDALDMDMNTPLALAIKRKDERTMKVLLAANADVFLCDKYGRTFFQMGFGVHTMSRPGMAKMLFEEMRKKYGNNIKEMAEILLEISDPFPSSLLLKNTALTRYMLKNGYTIHEKDWDGNTALHYAVDCMDLENVKLLLELGSDIHAKNMGLETPIHLYHFGKEENYEFLHYLLKQGACLNDVNYGGFSVIDKTFENEKAEHVKVLLDHGVDLSKLNGAYTPIHSMACNKNPGVMELLEGRSFDVDVCDSNGQTALFTAAEYANYDAMKFLLKNGADPNFVDDDGNTVLATRPWSCKRPSRDTSIKYVNCIQLLLQYGTDVQFMNSQQKSLFDDVSDLVYIRPAIAQMAMMKELDQRVEDLILAKIQSHEVFEKYFNVCLRKMKKIKSTVICNKVSLSIFLVEPEEKLLIYARNQESRAKLERFLRRARRSTLYFMKLLWNRVESIVEFTKLREQAALTICKLSGCYNQQVIDKIVLFLDKQSIRNLCQI